MKKTPWFNTFIKPDRRGIYETVCAVGRGFAYWNGKCWSNQRQTMAGVRSTRDTNGAIQDKAWRGLAKKP